MKTKWLRFLAYIKGLEIKPKEACLWAAALVAVLALFVGFGSLAAGQGQVFPVYISEVIASNTSYPNPEGRCCDVIEIHNSADYPLDLSGFQLGDIAGKSRYAFPTDTVIGAGEYLAVYCDKTVEDGTYAPFEINRAGGEMFYLIAKNGAVVDSVTTASMDVDQSMTLELDGSWKVTQTPTPGGENSDLATGFGDVYNRGVSPVRITEFSCANTGFLPQYGQLCDWVELYNTGSEPSDISGFTLSDNVGNDKYTFPQGTVLEAGEYRVVYCTDRVADPQVAPFGLSDMREETLVLKDSHGMIAELIRSQAMKDGAMALQPEGDWVQTQELTPGYENTAAGHQTYLEKLGAQAGSVRIREVMAADQMALADSFGQFSDWVELENTTNRQLDLSGWCLSDDPAQPDKWMIPQLVLQPGEREVIFCSGRDKVVSGEVHAGFALSAGGESLTLSCYLGTVVDTVNIPESEDHTAVIFDDAGNPSATPLPSPGYPNDEAGYEAFCDQRLPAGPLAIWEVMTSNDRYLPQLLGECYDWVELRNVSQAPVDLSGFTITDDPDQPDKHKLAQQTLQPGQCVTVILSGEENVTKRGVDNALFTLNVQQDQLLLYDAGGALLDYVFLRQIPVGCSYGRSQESGGFSYMEPSPQNPNTAGYRLISSDVVSSYVPGVYTQEDHYDVTLSAAGDIYYTTDGSVPDRTSARYEAPLQIDSTTVVRAVAIEEGKLASEVYTATFVMGREHTLPVVSLVTDPDGLWGYNGIYRNGDMDVKEIRLPANVAYSGPDGSFALDCETNLHGATTVRAFNKKSFAVRFEDAYDGPLHYDVFEDGEVTTYSSLIIRTSHESTVSTQLHDAMIGYIASQCSDKVLSQKHKYVSLYLNGEYWGLYALRERHSQEHYASYMDVPAESVEIVRFMTDADNTLHDLYDYIGRNSLKVQENYAHVKTVLDVESFADWMIFEAYMSNMDINGNIRYYRSDVDGLWRMGLVDLDLGIVGSHAAFDEMVKTFHHARLVRALLASEEFKDLLARRLAELLAGPLSDENVIATIRQMADTIRPETVWEEERWGTPVGVWEWFVEDMVSFCDGRAQEMIDSLCVQLNLNKEKRAYYFGELG